MAARDLKQLPLVVIAGPTASGKTALAIKLANDFQGEIISADSRTVYKYADIGTAKPTLEERSEVPHWGIDIVEPDAIYTAADFKQYTAEKISEIRSRGHVPFLVGGTGLYIDAILFDYQFGDKADPVLREKLNELSLEKLHDYCYKHNITLPENRLNKRYVIRAIEQKSINLKRRTIPIENTIIVAIATDNELLRTRIMMRSEQLFENGVVDEAKELGKKYGWDAPALSGNIYPLIFKYLSHHETLKATKAKSVTQDWRLAKRQLTWLRRNSYITWLNLDEAESYIRERLATLVKP